MLVEGYDEPSLAILGIKETIKNPLLFVQLVGRVVRYDKSQDHINHQEAKIIVPERDFQNAQWNGFSKFENEPEDIIVSKNGFVKSKPELSSSFFDALCLTPSFQIKANPTLKPATIHSRVSEWAKNESRNIQKSYDKFVEQRKSVPSYSIFLFEKKVPSTLLKRGSFDLYSLRWSLLIFV
ncbi:MAG: hypothetical protein KDD48_04200, partial [Bdellovibrionales bacterium]|nr:hypothetical protein [Bdellovibrionales bacterium]